nr:alkaline phosphatase family protein [Candidatus Baldrarchaeota archaeon]
MKPKEKLILIGVDGATWKIINPLIEDGKLPTFELFVSEGAYGTLESTVPPNTPPAWTSIFTGVNPGKHGITDFSIREEDGSFHLPHRKMRGVHTIWSLTNLYDLKCIVINDPVTYPPEKVNGIMTTGLLTPPGSKNYVWPKDKLTEINSAANGYLFELNKEFYDAVRKGKEAKACSLATEFDVKLTKTFLYLMSNYEWDIASIIYVSSDRLQHYYWDNKELLRSYYVNLDKQIHRILDVAPNATVILVSDHGFRSVKKYFYINTYLYNKGLLRVKKSIIRRLCISMHLTREKIADMLERSNLLGLFDILIRFLPIRIEMLPPASELDAALIDYANSIAFAYGYRGIYLNSNNATILKNITKMIENIKDEDNRVISRVYYSKDVVWGPYSYRSPALYVYPEGEYIISTRINNNIFGFGSASERLLTGDHDVEGIFAIYGRNIKKLRVNNSIKTWDIAPTLLHLLGMPIPTYMDGKVLKDIFKDTSEPFQRSIKYLKNVDHKVIKRKIIHLKK